MKYFWRVDFSKNKYKNSYRKIFVKAYLLNLHLLTKTTTRKDKVTSFCFCYTFLQFHPISVFTYFNANLKNKFQPNFFLY